MTTAIESNGKEFVEPSHADILRAAITAYGSVSRFEHGALVSFVGANLSDANLYGANLSGAKNIIAISGLGSEQRIAYFVRHDTGLMIQAGCFWGTDIELLEASAWNYGAESAHYRGYGGAVALAKLLLGMA